MLITENTTPPRRRLSSITQYRQSQTELNFSGPKYSELDTGLSCIWILACPILDSGLSYIGFWPVLYWILACPVLDPGLSSSVLYWILACPVWIPVCPQECPSLDRYVSAV